MRWDGNFTEFTQYNLQHKIIILLNSEQKLGKLAITLL